MTSKVVQKGGGFFKSLYCFLFGWLSKTTCSSASRESPILFSSILGNDYKGGRRRRTMKKRRRSKK